jgi:hypothetical protein
MMTAFASLCQMVGRAVCWFTDRHVWYRRIPWDPIVGPGYGFFPIRADSVCMRCGYELQWDYSDSPRESHGYRDQALVEKTRTDE